MFEVNVKHVTEGRRGEEGDQVGFGVLICVSYGDTGTL